MKATVGTKTSGSGKKALVKLSGTHKSKTAAMLRKHKDRPVAELRAKSRGHTAVPQFDARGEVFCIRHAVDSGESSVGVSQARSRLGLTQPEFSRVIGCSTRSIAGWEADGASVTPLARRRVIEFDRLGGALAEIIPPGEVGRWLKTPNAAFEGQTPLQVIERGESDRLWQMVHQIDANVAN